jgi:hypothetical protein
MAKKLLLDALTAAIGDFVEGISEDNLKLGIWGGKVSSGDLGSDKAGDKATEQWGSTAARALL